MQVKNILTTYSEEDILQLPVMNNGRKLATMEFLHMIIPSCVYTNPLLGVVATCRMVKISLEWLVNMKYGNLFITHTLQLTLVCSPWLHLASLPCNFILYIGYRGICDISAYSFAVYSAFFVSPFCQDYEGAHQYGKVALKVLARLSLGAQHRVS